MIAATYAKRRVAEYCPASREEDVGKQDTGLEAPL